MAKKYPDAMLILAHAARSFASWTGVESIEKVAHLENVWYDFTAVCESPAMIQIMKKAGTERCMWGSDAPICFAPGKAISLDNGFHWMYEEEYLETGVRSYPFEETIELAKIIIAGIRSREEGGRKVMLSEIDEEVGR